jgi:UDP-glucose 4-epimerase
MVLITGGMGFIGLHTARAFLSAGQSVVLSRHRSSREPEFLKQSADRVAIVNLDVTSPFECLEVIRKHRVDSIVHLSAPPLGALPAGEEFRVNLMGLINVLEAGRLSGVSRISVASSIGVYAGLNAGPFREDQPLPIESSNPVEAFKKSMETLSLHYSERTGTDVIVLRIAAIWGPLYRSMFNLPSRMIHGALRDRKVDLASGPGGLPYEEDAFDLCYVTDCATGIYRLHSARRLSYRIYNVGSGRAISNRELRSAVIQSIPAAEITLNPGRSGGYRPDAFMSLDRIRADAGYQPQYDLSTAVAEYADWLRANNPF